MWYIITIFGKSIVSYSIMAIEPEYIELSKSGELESRVEKLKKHLESCDVCPRNCGTNRLKNETGECGIGAVAQVSSAAPHHGEEDPLRGTRGSGTIFFTGCNLKCQFCQNHDISQEVHGVRIDSKRLAAMMLELQKMGCHNINFVSPSHVVPQIAEALLLASGQGLKLPLIYNSGGYDSLEILKLLDGIIDIYMPDMKYGNPENAEKYSKIPDYPGINQTAVKEMHSQVGDLVLDKHGIAMRGILIRHLVLPENLASTDLTAEFLAQNISKDTYINVMDQYHPSYRARDFRELTRGITSKEFEQAVDWARKAGLNRLDKRKPMTWRLFDF
jgi:putative pyruvate formate lyase activating enzyme